MKIVTCTHEDARMVTEDACKQARSRPLTWQPLRHLLAALLLLALLALTPAAGMRQESSPASINIQIKGAQAYGSESAAPVKSALLMLDTISFGGKSGLVTLHKGQTTMYVVLSNLDIGCEMKDVYDRKGFLRGNLPRLLPNLPPVEKDQDFVAVFMYQQRYDPRKVTGPPLAGLIAGPWQISDFYHLIPGGWTPKPKEVESQGGTLPNAIHFTEVLFSLRHVSAGEKGHSLTGKSKLGSWAYGVQTRELYLDPTRHEPPFDRSMLDLIRDGEGWAAKFDLSGPSFKLSGRVPLRVCQPNFIAVQ